MTMSEIGLLITGILTTRQLPSPNKLPKQQPFQMENSAEKLTHGNLSQLVRTSQITPPEFIETDPISPRNLSTSNLAKKQLFEKITNTHLFSVALPSDQNYYASDYNSVEFPRPWPRFSGLPLPILRFGSSGTSVRVLQRLLVSNGYAIRVDGSFGPLTETAVKAFQNQRRVTVDGIVGPVTWQQLTI
ncbi:peptidoglycan-binding domain-containing protein [Umezakia ovalisporum]|jgi:murein L,D-transpeptidase YcbB/YkuD|uniref:peptidoglycan-binding domain-containing protein n=2 Tax=Umezakia ovalisporum TaxID=75695 RepID=UPI0028CB9BF8|nr:peptidoglycan-binding domain-containing protein [Umezakia ovalisporum]